MPDGSFYSFLKGQYSLMLAEDESNVDQFLDHVMRLVEDLASYTHVDEHWKKSCRFERAENDSGRFYFGILGASEVIPDFYQGYQKMKKMVDRAGFPREVALMMLDQAIKSGLPKRVAHV